MEERIRIIQNNCGCSQQEFAARLGISPASLSSIYNRRTRPSQNHVNAVHRAFPEISLPWLMFGEGDMYVPGYDPSEKTTGFEAENKEASPLQAGMQSDEASSAERNLWTAAAQVASKPRPVDTPLQPKAAEAQANRSQRREVRSPARPVEMEKEMPRENVVVPIPRRKITEIRVFFDDGTYEAFNPLVL